MIPHLGVTTGEPDGVPVGNKVGPADGDPVGKKVGTLLTVGASVKGAVGMKLSLGAKLGLPLGIGLGSSVSCEPKTQLTPSLAREKSSE